MTDTEATPIEDPPNPELDDVQQREVPSLACVPVRIEGPVRVLNLPNRFGGLSSDVLMASDATNARPIRILDADQRRAVATLIGSDAWYMMRQSTGTRAPIPANVPVVVTHAEAVWALGQAGKTVTLTAIQEFYAN